MTRPVFEPTSQREIRKNKFSADQLFRRPGPPRGAASGVMPAMRVHQTSNFTVTDGAYYGLAQTTGANPSATGVADNFEFFNDPFDGTGAFDVISSGTGGVLKIMDTLTGGGRLVSYDAGVVFTTTISTPTVLVSLWMGTGVGSGIYSWEFEVMELNMASNNYSTGLPTIRVSGTVVVDNLYPTTPGSRPTISPILLVEGGTPTVTELWCYLTVLSDADSTGFFP